MNTIQITSNDINIYSVSTGLSMAAECLLNEIARHHNTSKPFFQSHAYTAMRLRCSISRVKDAYLEIEALISKSRTGRSNVITLAATVIKQLIDKIKLSDRPDKPTNKQPNKPTLKEKENDKDKKLIPAAALLSDIVAHRSNRQTITLLKIPHTRGWHNIQYQAQEFIAFNIFNNGESFAETLPKWALMFNAWLDRRMASPENNPPAPWQ